jgi:hypothetical protein
VDWLLQDKRGRAAFDKLAHAHDGDMGGQLRDHGEAMRDQQIGEMKLLLQFLKEQKYLRADGHIEGRDGLIGNDERRAKNQGAGDANALTLSAGEFVGIAIHGIVGKANAAEEVRGASEALGTGKFWLVNRQRFGNDFTDTHARIQRGEGVLENHLHVAALQAQGFAGESKQIIALVQNGAVIGFDEAQQHARQGGFAATTFADDGEGFAGLDEKANIVNSDEALTLGFRGKQSTAPAVGFAKRARFEERGHNRMHLAE